MNGAERREYNARYQKENKDKLREKKKIYKEQNKEKINEESKKYRKNNKNKIKARSYSGGMERRGKITKQKCSLCGSKEELEFHHPDYKKPTKHKVLCKKCHVKTHNNLRASK